MSAESANTPGRSLGTAPVLLAGVSTILGAIMYLRFGYAVGHLGLVGALLVILLGHAVTIPTALALAEIATNRRVAGGGEYFIISRSFGQRFGGAVGASLYLSQALSVGFYCSVGLSGDLAHPRRSIPSGTLGATAIGLVAYVAIVFKLAGNAPADVLAHDQFRDGPHRQVRLVDPHRPGLRDALFGHRFHIGCSTHPAGPGSRSGAAVRSVHSDAEPNAHGELTLLSCLCERHGFGTYTQRIEGRLDAESFARSERAQEDLLERAAQHAQGVQVQTLVRPSRLSALAQALQLPGVSGMRNNDVFNTPFMLLLAYVLLSTARFRAAELSVNVALPTSEVGDGARQMRQLLEAGRIPVASHGLHVVAVDDHAAYRDAVQHRSASADLVICGLTADGLERRGTKRLRAHAGLARVLFVAASEHVRID